MRIKNAALIISYLVKLFHLKKNEKAWCCDMNSAPNLCLASVFFLDATHPLHNISDLWLLSALHFYGVAEIPEYAKKDEDQARTDRRNIIHVLSHWVPAYALLNLLLGEDVQKRLVASWVVLACCVWPANSVDSLGHESPLRCISVAVRRNWYVLLFCSIISTLILRPSNAIVYDIHNARWHYCLLFWEPFPA